VADHPARRARRLIRRDAAVESARAVRFARKTVMFAAKRLYLAGDSTGNHLALTAATAIDDLLRHLEGPR
jgi:acetyl esterase/lipase